MYRFVRRSTRFLAKWRIMVMNLLESLENNPFFSGGLSLMMIGALGAILRHLPRRIWHLLERRISIAVEVPDRDPAFRWLQTWLAEGRYAKRARDLSLSTEWVSSEPDPEINPYDDRPSGPASQARFVLSPAPGVHLTTYQRRILVVRRNRRELQNGGSTAIQESLILQIPGGSRKLIDDLLAEAHATSFPRTPGVSILVARNEIWCPASWQPKRPLGSLILADSILEDTIEDLRDFYRSSAWYAERGIPYRRGYLLHGPPGTGKTTLVLALAGELKLPVATLNLSNRLMSDDSLRTLIDGLPAAALLLIEDIDCAFKDCRNTTSASGVTLSGLLNALDGVSSREGRVLFLTTNHPERLDPALLRPGRVDRKIELGYATPDQARRLYLWFYRGCGMSHFELSREAERFAAQVPPHKIGMAAVQEHLLRHRRSPGPAAHEVVFDEIGPEFRMSVI
jgi:mitochondrial chaperone BCS1